MQAIDTSGGKAIEVKRSELYELVWSKPVRMVALELSDHGADCMGRFWYQVAAGEVELLASQLVADKLCSGA